MEKTLTRETAVALRFRLDTLLAIAGQYLPHDILAETEQLLRKADCELYPALFGPGINLEQSFEDFKRTLDNPLPPTLAAYANIEKEINDYIPT